MKPYSRTVPAAPGRQFNAHHMAKFLSILLAGLSLLFPNKHASAESPASVSGIAVVVPLTGALAFLGQNIQEGFELYVEQHRDFRDSVKIIVEDSGTTEIGKAISAARRIIDADKPDALILGLSPLVAALKDELDRIKLPALAVIGSDTTAGMKYGFKLWIPAKREFSVVAQAMLDRDQRTVAVIATDQISCVQRMEGFIEALKELGAADRVLAKFQVSSAEELPTIAAKITALKPAAVVNVLLNGHSGIFARELRRLGYRGPMYGSVVMDDEAELKISQGALANAEYPYVAPSEEFESAYRRKYGHRPGVGASNGYDIALILHESIKKLGSLHDHAQVAEFIRNTEFSGAMGHYRYEENGQNAFSFKPVLVKVRGS